MADYAWPDALPPQTMVWQIQKYGTRFVSPYSGTTESVTFPGWKWRVSITLKPMRSKTAVAGMAEGFFNGMAGGENGVLLYHWLRQVPRGTMRGTPTVAASVARGASSLTITTPGTLLAGDLFKIGGTVYQALADAVNVAGVITVLLSGRAHAAIASGAPVTWDRPTIRCIMPSMSNAAAYRPAVLEGMPIDLEEG